MKRFAEILAGVVAIIALGCASPICRADSLTPGSTGSNAGDWSQGWYENNVGQFDTIYAFIETPGLTFSAPGLSILPVTGWTPPSTWNEIDSNPQFASASFSPTTDLLYFSTNFTPAQNVPITLDFYALLQGQVVDAAKLVWDGNGPWDITGISGAALENENMATPEPGSLFLLGTGLLGLAFIIFRKAKPSPRLMLNM